MPMNALEKEEVIPEEVAQDLVHPANLHTNREFRVVLNQRHEPNQRRDSSNGPPSQSLADRLLNAREVASRLGVSERWVRDHTTRRSPRIRAVKLGPLVRYRWTDVEVFMESLDTFQSSRRPRFGV
jgi:predicted DNA-binding transcriptional regulator AlpA